MFEACLQRFKQHPLLTNLLFATENRDLLFISPEGFWGVGTDGNGANKFGKILMKIRGECSVELRDSAAYLI
jgi:predicted NAD-dependent protein-ADP-ribosyltransferase YbiA (DUF1768 family)